MFGSCRWSFLWLYQQIKDRRNSFSSLYKCGARLDLLSIARSFVNKLHLSSTHTPEPRNVRARMCRPLVYVKITVSPVVLLDHG